MSHTELKFATLDYKAPILYLRIKEGAMLDVPQVEELSAAIKNLCGDTPYLLLTNPGLSSDITPEGRNATMQSRRKANIIANAIIVRVLGQRLVATVFSVINQPPFPVKVFKEEGEAVSWLMKQYNRKEAEPAVLSR